MSSPQSLDTAKIERGIAESDIFWKITGLDTCKSTNLEALEMISSDPDLERTGLAIFTEWQSEGRGRRERHWESPPSRDLLFSVALRPDLQQKHWGRFTHAAALGICMALKPQFETKIKWPNDIYIQSQKVAGILVESYPCAASTNTAGIVIIGIGINVNTAPDNFPDNLAAPATSLWIQSGDTSGLLEREKIATSVLISLHHQIKRCEENFPAMLKQIEASSEIYGKQVTVTLPVGEKITGTVCGFGAEGELLLTPKCQADTVSKKLIISAANEIRLVEKLNNL